MSINESPDRSDVLDTSYVSTVVSVSTTQTEAKVGASPLAGRQELVLFNDGTQPVYYGPSGVTSSGSTKGIPIYPNAIANIQVGEGISIFMITASSSSNIIVQEFA